MKKHLSILFVLLLLAGAEASAEIIQGYVLLNGKQTPADYTLLSRGVVGLGTGQNACISQYAEGRVVVPSEITVEKKFLGVVVERNTYRVEKVMPVAFRFCNQLKMVQFKEGITHIGNFAFKGCSNLEDLILPSTLQSVGSGAFIGLDKLNYLTCHATTPPVWEYNDVFCFHEGGISDTQVHTFRQGVFLNVPVEAADDYKASVFSDPSLGWTTPEGWGTLFTNVNGSALENFHVSDEQDLEDVRRISNNTRKFGNIKNLWLEADVVMSDTIWPEPIGAHPEEPFLATIHGQGHHIENLKIENDDVAALIGYYAGTDISNLRIRGGHFTGKHMVAGIVAAAGDCTIDSCLVDCNLKGTDYVGGIAAKVDGKVYFDRCFSDGHLTNVDSETTYAGGIVGYVSKGASVTNCAVMKTFNTGSNSGHFVGGCGTENDVLVDYSYSMNALMPNSGADRSFIGEHVILYGQQSTALTYSGDKLDIEYRGGHMQCTYPASVLGTEGWVYAWDKYPLPDCFVDEWPVRDNYVIYGSEGAMQLYDNVLTPDEDIPAEDWRDLTDLGFRHYRFKASRLRINERLDVQSRAEELPLGISRQIVSTNGVVHDAVLRAEYQGLQDIILPVYEMDGENNFVLDANGQPILIDHAKVGEQEVWQSVGYALSLPYDVTFGSNATLYQPTRIYDVNGQTTALFEPVKDNRAEPFRPYYLLVRKDSVILGTNATVHSTSLDGAVMQVGAFEFSGAMSNVHFDARKDNTYTLKDGSWQLQSATDHYYAAIEPFTSFFRAVGDALPDKIVMTFGDDHPVISVGDFYFTLNSDDGATYTATLTGYHGRGGNAVVPPTIATAIGGIEQQIPVTRLGPDIFTVCTAEVWSIDLSRCSSIEPVTVNRTASGNPFYSVDERTIIYLPEGKLKTSGASPATPKNVVVGTECASLALTDGWDFCPPYSFHATEATYDRVLYAAKQQDGSYKSKTYTVCLPFDVDLGQQRVDGQVEIYILYYVMDGSKLLFSNDIPMLYAGKAYGIKVNNGSVDFRATDVEVKAQPHEGEVVAIYEFDFHVVGHWRGSFARISNEEAANRHAYTMTDGKWFRIRSDEGRYRNAYVNTFRAFYEPLEPNSRNSYNMVFKQWVAGDTPTLGVVPFPSDFFDTDTDFSAYEKETDGIEQLAPALSPTDRESIYTLDGRKIDGQPRVKGMYIVNGKKIVIQ